MKTTMTTFLALTLVMTLAACGTPAVQDTGANTIVEVSTTAGYGIDSDIVEHDAPRPRALVSSADSGEIVVLDLDDGEEVAHLEVDGPVSMSANPDARVAMAGNADKGEVVLLDGGTWSEGHGDHFHHYTSDPMILGTVAGEQPSHLVHHDGLLALFFDGTGTAAVLTEDQVLDGDLQPMTLVESGLPHHGVGLPFAGHILLSRPGGNPEVLPDGVLVFHDEDLETELGECPELHGEAVVGDVAYFACSDGVLAVSQPDWQTSKVEYPEVDDVDPFGYGAARVWAFAAIHESPWWAGIYGGRHLLMLQEGTTEPTLVQLPAEPSIFGLGVLASDEVVVLTTDGDLHLVDPSAGAVTQTLALIDPFEVDFEAPTPRLSVLGTRVFITNPDHAALIEVAGEGGLAVMAEHQLDITPGSLALVGG